MYLNVLSFVILIFALTSGRVGGTWSTADEANCSSCSTRNILYISAYCDGENFHASRALIPIEEALNSSESFTMSALNVEYTAKVSQIRSFSTKYFVMEIC